MKRTLKSGLAFDESYWPTGSTLIAALIGGFGEDEWNQFDIQVAELLKIDPPSAEIKDWDDDGKPSKISLTCYVWSVGGRDCMTLEVDLVKEFRLYADVDRRCPPSESLADSFDRRAGKLRSFAESIIKLAEKCERRAKKMRRDLEPKKQEAAQTVQAIRARESTRVCLPDAAMQGSNAPGATHFYRANMET